MVEMLSDLNAHLSILILVWMLHLFQAHDDFDDFLGCWGNTKKVGKEMSVDQAKIDCSNDPNCLGFAP